MSALYPRQQKNKALPLILEDLSLQANLPLPHVYRTSRPFPLLLIFGDPIPHSIREEDAQCYISYYQNNFLELLEISKDLQNVSKVSI